MWWRGARALRAGKRKKFSAAFKRIAPATRGFLEFHLRWGRAFDPYFGPMNGQTARLEIVREIITELDIALIVETGTFRGVTTQWFTQFGVNHCVVTPLNVPVSTMSAISSSVMISRTISRRAVCPFIGPK